MRVRALLLLLALLAAGCTSSNAPTALHSPTPLASSTESPTQSPIPSPASSPTAEPSPRPTSSELANKTFPMLVKFSCRLPAQLTGPGDEGTLPGFLDLATGHFVSDPKAKMNKVSTHDKLHTVATPVLTGWYGTSYSWAAGRWLPTDWKYVAPDGLHYAYPEVETPFKLHVVDIRTGSDRVISSGTVWGILDYRADGIYVTKTRYYAGESNNGLWRMNPTTGSLLQLLPESAATLDLSGAAAWGSDVPIFPTTLYRYDLKTGARTIWFKPPSHAVGYIASDSSGRPLVGVFASGRTGALWLLSSPFKGTVLHTGDGGPWYGSAGSTDSHGTWLDGLWLLRPNGQLTHVTTAPVRALGTCA